MSQKQRVLVVDDEARNQRIIVEILEDIVDLKVCSTGQEALDCIEDFNPDLVLLDIMMPGLNGYEVCRAIRATPKLQLTKVVLVSGKAMIDERLEGYACGADSYMTKPFVPEELLAISKVFLRLTHVEREFAALNHDLEKEVQKRTQQLIEAEGKLIGAAKMSALGEMAGGIAHEINTPLGTIGMLGETIREHLEAESVDREALLNLTDMIASTVKRISLIITGLRTFSRDASSDGFVRVRFKEILDDTLSLCNERIKQSGVKVSAEGISPDLELSCRHVQISQVLLNLISNSCDAIVNESDKWIKIFAEQDDGAVKITVTDCGKGIPAAVAAKLFQPFFTTKDIGKGTGLGLSISKGIINAHGGSIEIDSACANTRFVIRLPQAVASAKAA